MKNAIAFFVYSNLWISIGAACMAWMYYQLTGSKVNLLVLLFLFFSTLVTYTFQRFIKLFQNESIEGPRIIWMKKNPIIVKFIMVSGILGSTIIGMTLSWKSILFLISVGLISFLYAYKFKFFNVQTNLRDLPGIKIYLIGGVWASSCAILPAIELNYFIFTTYLVSVGYFLFIVAITIPFDIRDLNVDEKDKNTLPQLTGVTISKMISCVMIVISYFLMMENITFNMGLFCGYLIAVILIVLSNTDRNELFYSFYVDGLLILVPILYYFLSRPEFISN